MSIENLDKIFQPKSIAVVGASERDGSVGAALMRNLIERNFPGDIFPINPKHNKLWGKSACPSITDLKTAVDLAIIASPKMSAPQIVKECAAAGVGGAIIISAGGKEIGEEGKKVEAVIKKEAEVSGLRIIGPNCVGIMASRSKLNASFANQMTLTGKMAFISQSGAICTAILDLSIKENIGFSYFVSLGDMLDVDFGDMIDYLGGKSEVSSIVMYVESLTHFRKFMSAARAVSRVKPIIALKAAGRVLWQRLHTPVPWPGKIRFMRRHLNAQESCGSRPSKSFLIAPNCSPNNPDPADRVWRLSPTPAARV